MKKFSVPCDFNGQKSPFTIYIGYAKPDHHPIHFQSDWLSKERGGTVPPEVMDSLSKLRELSDQNGVPFEELCVYALGAAQQAEEEEKAESEEDDTSVDAGDAGAESGPMDSTADDVAPAGDSTLDDDEDGLKRKNQ